MTFIIINSKKIAQARNNLAKNESYFQIMEEIARCKKSKDASRVKCALKITNYLKFNGQNA